MQETLSQYWWVFLLRGILAVLFGIAAFGWPGLTLIILVIFFGAFCLMEGVCLTDFHYGRLGNYRRSLRNCGGHSTQKGDSRGVAPRPEWPCLSAFRFCSNFLAWRRGAHTRLAHCFLCRVVRHASDQPRAAIARY